MPSLLESAGLTHFNLLKKQAGVTADYVSGLTTVASDITVIPSSRITEQSNAEGVITQSLNDDILILVSDLPGHTPIGGDQIKIKNDAAAVVQTNEVDRAPPADFEDSYRSIFRIHTRVVG